MKLNQLIIFGGGASIKLGLTQGLQSKLNNKFILGCNWAYKTINPTATCFVDYNTFYSHSYEDIKNLPLLLGYKLVHEKPEYLWLSNTYGFKNTSHYTRDLSTGIYTSFLTGLLALTLGIYLLDVGEIFLLGMDFGGEPGHTEFNFKTIRKKILTKTKAEDFIPKTIKNNCQNNKRAITHYYQNEIEHEGIGKIQGYYTNDVRDKYECYKEETKCKIYNVSPYSRIPEDIFEKISYDKMFKLLDNKQYDQDELRVDILEKLEGKFV